MAHKKYLFLCEHGEKRSPTFASVARELLGESNDYAYGAYSMISQFGQRVFSHLNSFDFIVVAEEYMGVGLIKIGLSEKKIFCLNVSDEYSRDSPELREIARQKLNPLLTRLC